MDSTENRIAAVGGVGLILFGSWRLRRLKAIDRITVALFGSGCALLGCAVTHKKQRNWTRLRTADNQTWKREFDSLTDPKARGFVSECWIRYRQDDPKAFSTFFALFGYQDPNDYFLHDTNLPRDFVRAIPKYSDWLKSHVELTNIDIERACQSLGIDHALILDELSHAAIVGRECTTDECRALLAKCSPDDHLLREAAILNWRYTDDWDSNTLFNMITEAQFEAFSADAKHRLNDHSSEKPPPTPSPVKKRNH